jgi:hypothetical protein
MVWTSEFSNETSAQVSGVYSSASGVYVVGNSGRILPGQTQIGAFIVKYDPSGTLVWLHQVGGGAESISGDSTGLYFAGGSLRKYDFNSNLIWTAQIPPLDYSGNGYPQVTVDSSGVYVSIATAAGHEFLLKYDLKGGSVWTLQMQTPPYDEAFRLSAGTGGVFVVGSIQGPNGSNPALVALVSSSPSLVFFGVNPPLSFIIIAGLGGGSVASFVLFRNLLSRRVRPPRVGLGQRSRSPAD